MSGDPREQPVIDPQTHVYARWLDAGTRLGFVVLLATFLAYVTGFFPAGTPIDDLPRFWTLPVEDYLKASGATTGWAWIWRLRYGDALTYFGVAIIAAVTMVCYLAILPVLVRRRERLYVAIAVVQVVVLVLAAAGWGAH